MESPAFFLELWVLKIEFSMYFYFLYFHSILTPYLGLDFLLMSGICFLKFCVVVYRSRILQAFRKCIGLYILLLHFIPVFSNLVRMVHMDHICTQKIN